MKKLSEVPSGTIVEIKELRVDEELLGRLLDLAFVPGEKIKVVINNAGNYVVVDSKRGRFGVPIGIANRIIVESHNGSAMGGSNETRIKTQNDTRIN